MSSELLAAGNRPSMAARRRDGVVSRAGIRLTSIDEQPAWVDPTLATFFQQLRALLGWPIEALAARLGTSPYVIDHLENGRLRALPPWPETERILNAYGVLVGMDLGPAARRIRHSTVAGDWQVDDISLPTGRATTPGLHERFGVAPLADEQARAAPVLPAPPASTGSPATVDSGRSRLGAAIARIGQWMASDARRLSRRPRHTALAAGLGAVLLLGWAAGPLLASGVGSLLPERATVAVAGWLGSAAIRRPGPDGLVWIDATDPRTRKADKLPSAPER